jgi:DNA-binding HxlR family transcriptional regulator
MNDAECPVAATVAVIGGKWKPTILFNLKDGPRRFNELRRLIPDITQRMLTMQLRALEKDGLVMRTVHERIPPRVDYAFTEKGWTLGPILEAMAEWGEQHAEPVRSKS